MRAIAPESVLQTARRSGAAAVQLAAPARRDDGPGPRTAHCACGGRCPACNGGAAKLSVARHRAAHIDSPMHRLARAPGQALPHALRSEWGTRLGADLSDIRVHPGAAEVAASGANAVNWGRHVFLRPGVPGPESTPGRELLGHEVAHALQTRADGPALAPGHAAEPVLEAEAGRVAAALAQAGTAPVPVRERGQAAGLRGDKQVAISGTDITVTDTYVVHGAGATSAFLTRFQSALDNYYNNPTFTHRGYDVHFVLSVRMANVDADGEVIDSVYDDDTETFAVTTGSSREGGFVELSLNNSSDQSTIAHEVGHYLSNKTGYMSERYSENPLARVASIFGYQSTSTPDPGCENDIMATLSGRVDTCSLEDFLDEQIDEHEQTLTDQAEAARLFREGGPMPFGDYMLPGGFVIPSHAQP